MGKNSTSFPYEVRFRNTDGEEKCFITTAKDPSKAKKKLKNKGGIILSIKKLAPNKTFKMKINSSKNPLETLVKG